MKALAYFLCFEGPRVSGRNSLFVRILAVPLNRTQSLFMCFAGERRLGAGVRLRRALRRARGLIGRDEGKIATLFFLTPNLLSPPKHINSDWVRV